jgi:hypothetical protein
VVVCNSDRTLTQRCSAFYDARHLGRSVQKNMEKDAHGGEDQHAEQSRLPAKILWSGEGGLELH